MTRIQALQRGIPYFILPALGILFISLSLIRISPLKPVRSRDNTVSLSGFLTFRAGEHVMGFRPAGVAVAGPDHSLDIAFVHANPVAPAAGASGTGAGTGFRDAPPLITVAYKNLWNGVDLVYERYRDGIWKSTYYIRPNGAGVPGICLAYNRPVALEPDGCLAADFPSGRIRELAPVAWQIIDGRQIPVEASFALLGNNRVGFRVGAHNPDHVLVIDPALEWHAVTNKDTIDPNGTGIALDGSGNVYVAGYKYSFYCDGTVQSWDSFALKFSGSGSLLWHTYLGAAGNDYCKGIGLDSSGNVYVAGRSGQTWGSPVNAHSALGPDWFAAKLDNEGNYIWNTFHGENSTATEQAQDLVVDGSGNLYLAGYSRSWAGPPPANTAPKRAFPGAAGMDSGMVVELDTDGQYQWHTFLGGGQDAYCNSIALDGSGNVYVAGTCGDAWGSANIRRPYTGGLDVFVAKLSNSGDLLWHTFLGSSAEDMGYDIALDGSGNLYVTGVSAAGWNETPVTPHTGGSRDMFIAKLDNNGTLEWHTFQGSAGDDYGQGIAVHDSGGVYITGFAGAGWGTPVQSHAGGNDAVVIRLDHSGSLKNHMFLGSDESDKGRDLVVNDTGDVFLTGYAPKEFGSPVSPTVGTSTYKLPLVARINNSPPETSDPIADVSVSYGSANTTLDLSSLFTDPDDDDAAITYTLVSSSAPSVISASVSGNTLTLDNRNKSCGPAAITVRGTSWEKTADAAVTVNVACPPQPGYPPGYVWYSRDNSGNTLTDLTIINMAVVSYGTVAGTIAIKDGTLDGVEILAGAIVTGGRISGTVENNGTLSDLSILAGAQVTGGALSDLSVLDGALVTGATLSGAIDNAGTLADVDLAAGAVIKGGQMTGAVTGDPDDPALVTAEIGPGAKLSHVIIQSGAVVHPDTVFGSGVRFAENSLIPAGADLTGIVCGDAPGLASLGVNQAIGLSCSLLTAGGTCLLEAVNKFPELSIAGLVLEQDTATGMLTAGTAGQGIILFPISVFQSGTGLWFPGITVKENGTVVVVTGHGRVITFEPMVADPKGFCQLLSNAGLGQDIDYESGIVTVDSAGVSRIVLRPDPHVAEAQDAPSASSPAGAPPGFKFASMAFSRNGALWEQTLYPAPFDWPALESTLETFPGVSGVTWKKQGIISLEYLEEPYQWMLDYTVTMGSEGLPGRVRILPVPDRNGDGTDDIRLVYPGGEEQVMYGME